MENISDLTFSDNDDIAPVAKPSVAPQPMVVVQYRQRGVPLWAVFLLVVSVPTCLILLYHSMFVGRVGALAAETAQAVRTKLDAPAAEKAKKAPEPALPLALNSQPIAPAALAAPSGAGAAASPVQPGAPSPGVSPPGAPQPAAQTANTAAGNPNKARSHHCTAARSR